MTSRRMSTDDEAVLDSEEERLQTASSSYGKAAFKDVIEISSDEDEGVFTDRTNVPKYTSDGVLPNYAHRPPADVIDLTLSNSDSDDIPKSTIAEQCATFGDGSLRDDDNTVLTLNEPKTARKPLGTLAAGRSKTPKARRRRTPANTTGPSDDEENPFILPGSSADDSQAGGSGTEPHTPSGIPRALLRKAVVSSPRVGMKKATVAAEQARREEYAQRLFNELNEKVFHGGLPPETKLNWNIRLLTTAGRAKWHRSRDGVQTTEIELAVKILDEDARIRNTMAHEMCHLACWIIDQNPQENHGKLFKSWAAKIMRKVPHIEVTTRHSYDINYPYEWKCEQCSKIYGRFSKSIRPDECVCGACKVGKLLPQFTTRETSRTPAKAKANARNAAFGTRDSPRTVMSMPDRQVEIATHVETPMRSSRTRDQSEQGTGTGGATDEEFARLIDSLHGVDIAG